MKIRSQQTTMNVLNQLLVLRLGIIWATLCSSMHQTDAFVTSHIERIVSSTTAISREERYNAQRIVYSPSYRLPNFQSSSKMEVDSTQICNNSDGEIIGNIIFLLPNEIDAKSVRSKFGSSSPVENPSLFDAAAQLCKKVSYFSDALVEASIVMISGNDIADENLMNKLNDADIVIALGIQAEEETTFVKQVFSRRRDNNENNRKCHFAMDCSSETNKIPSLVGPYDEVSPSISSEVLPWTTDASGRRLYEQMKGLFDRWTGDDFVIALMIFLNQFSGNEIAWVKHSIDATWEKGPIQNAQEFYSMITKCGDCIVSCVNDEKCKECLDKLNEIDTRDQVASYRTIVSYESELLRDFSFCILQKNNIFNCESTVPTLPNVEPIKTFRNQPVTAEVARSILIGHLKDDKAPEGGLNLGLSWKVACGANVAYDQFPSQNQIFYESVNGCDMWYDPVFRVETLDGRNVWCKRHYKVRSEAKPGTFRFSVLDNGITSDEFWTIVGVADDLSWIVFHYAGAASAVGQRYLGGLLCTADGSLPPPAELEKIWKLFYSAGIAPWELYIVNNDPMSPGAIAAGPPPLDYFLKNVNAAKARKRQEQKQA